MNSDTQCAASDRADYLSMVIDNTYLSQKMDDGWLVGRVLRWNGGIGRV